MGSDSPARAPGKERRKSRSLPRGRKGGRRSSPGLQQSAAPASPHARPADSFFFFFPPRFSFLFPGPPPPPLQQGNFQLPALLARSAPGLSFHPFLPSRPAAQRCSSLAPKVGGWGGGWVLLSGLLPPSKRSPAWILKGPPRLCAGFLKKRGAAGNPTQRVPAGPLGERRRENCAS